MQKAQVVNMAQDNGRNVVLAVGDGANDVPMIWVSAWKSNVYTSSFWNDLFFRQQTFELEYVEKRVWMLHLPAISV